MGCKTHHRVFERESNPHLFSVSGKCRELNFSRSPATSRSYFERFFILTLIVGHMNYYGVQSYHLRVRQYLEQAILVEIDLVEIER